MLSSYPLQLKNKVSVGDGRTLCATLSNNNVAYVERKSNKYRINIYATDHKKRVGRLLPPKPLEWDSWLSLASDDGNGKYAVTDGVKKTLDIYNGTGNTLV